MHTAVVYDVTSGANSALDTGKISLAKYGIVDQVFIEILPSGAMTSGNVGLYDPDLSTSAALVSFATGTGSAPISIGWGPGVASGVVATNYLGGLPAGVPQAIQVKMPQLGSGVTGRMRVLVSRQGR